MKTKILYGVLFGGLVAGMGQAAFAQSSGTVKPQYQIPADEKDQDDDRKGINVGEGLTFFPTSVFGYGKDSNLFLTNTNVKSSVLYNWAPGFRLEAKSESAVYNLSYAALLQRYDSSHADNFNDQRGAATGEWVFNRSAGLKLGVEYNALHDPRGSTDRGLSDAPDQYYTAGPSGLFAYGANDAFGRFEIQGGVLNRRYTNNRANTAVSDRDTSSIAGRFFVRIAPKTSVLVEVRNDRFDYVLNTNLLDSKERRYFVGITWEATASTTGTIKVGRLKKDFDSTSRTDSSTGSWEANMQWKPLSYSTFDIVTSKSTAESTGLGDFVLSKRYSVAWNHDWTSRTKSSVTFSHNQDDFVNVTRSDKTDQIGLKFTYKLTRIWDLGGEFNHFRRDSNSSIFQYNRNLYQLTLGAAL